MRKRLNRHQDYIQEILSLCVVLVPLTPKNDETQSMCVDNQAINQITIMYRFPITRVEDIFDILIDT